METTVREHRQLEPIHRRYVDILFFGSSRSVDQCTGCRSMWDKRQTMGGACGVTNKKKQNVERYLSKSNIDHAHRPVSVQRRTVNSGMEWLKLQ